MKKSDVGVELFGELPCIVPLDLFLFREICGDKDLLETRFSAFLFRDKDGDMGMPQDLIGHVADKKAFER